MNLSMFDVIAASERRQGKAAGLRGLGTASTDLLAETQGAAATTACIALLGGVDPLGLCSDLGEATGDWLAERYDEAVLWAFGEDATPLHDFLDRTAVWHGFQAGARTEPYADRIAKVLRQGYVPIYFSHHNGTAGDGGWAEQFINTLRPYWAPNVPARRDASYSPEAGVWITNYARSFGRRIRHLGVIYKLSDLSPGNMRQARATNASLGLAAADAFNRVAENSLFGLRYWRMVSGYERAGEAGTYPRRDSVTPEQIMSWIAAMVPLTSGAPASGAPERVIRRGGPVARPGTVYGIKPKPKGWSTAKKIAVGTAVVGVPTGGYFLGRALGWWK